MAKPIFNEESPIFVCGTSRSGTNLMAACIRDQTENCVVGETHYFDDLRVRLNSMLGNRLGKDEQKICEDYFLALTHRPYGHHGDPECATMSRTGLTEAAAALGGCPDAYFLAYCKLQMERYGSQGWGEKTPRHALRMNEILELFPNARIIYMLRDPRGVVASYRDWKNQGGFDLEADPDHIKILEEEEKRTRKSYHPVIITLLWKAAFKAAQAAQELHGKDRIRIQQYELLCSEPDQQFSEVFSWIGSDAEVDSSNLTVQNSSYESYEEKGGVKSGPATRWRKKLTPREIGLIECVCGKTLQESGYEPMKPRVSPLTLGYDLVSTTPAVVGAVRANMSRSGNIVKYVAHRAKLAFK